MAVGRKSDYTASIPAVWSKDLFAQAESLTFWGNMEGPEGSSMPIIRKDDLTKEPGDTLKWDIVLALTGAGQTGDTTLIEGNEEALKIRQTSTTLTQIKHGVRWTDLASELITHNMRSTAKNQLAKWLAGKLDGRIFTELTGGGTTIPTLAKFFGGTATTRALIADSDAGGRMTWDDIVRLKAYAQVEMKIEPLKMDDGNEYFGLVAHPYSVMSLKTNDTKWSQAQREAQIRGDSNPLFTGAAGIIDGVILYSSNRVPRSLNGGTPDIQVSDNIFFGAQALCRGYGFYPKWVEQDFSYGEEAGVATRVLVGEKINVFDLTSGGGAAAADLTWIGGLNYSTAAVGPAQP